MNHLQIESHMTEEQLLRMCKRAATPEEMDRFLEHIADCDRCANRMAEILEEGPMLEVTPMFYESVLREIEQTSEERQVVTLPRTVTKTAAEQAVAVKQEHTPRAFRSYPFKVVLAACVTLVLMNVGAFGAYMGRPAQRNDFLDKSTMPLERISRQWMDTSQRWNDIMEGELSI